MEYGIEEGILLPLTLVESEQLMVGADKMSIDAGVNSRVQVL